MSWRYIIIVFWGLFISRSAMGQSPTIENQAAQTDTIRSKKVDILLIPIVFYTPETNFAFGAGGQMFFKTKRSTSPTLNSSMFASLIYTLNKQFMLEVKPQVYFLNEDYSLDGKFKYKVFPNLFWGIGPNSTDSLEENYNQTEISVTAAFLKSLPSKVNFGFEFNYAQYSMTEVEPGGLLDTGDIEGADGATLMGLGFVLNVDSRDNIFSPLEGGFFQFKTNFTSRVLGSNYSFNTYYLDFRKYFKIGAKHILAAQFYTRLTYGVAPFQAKSHYGGGDLARGFYRGRYIDDHLYVVQVEYRMPILKRWELAFFALTGNVGNNNDDIGLFDDFKSSFGFGPRFFIYKDRRTLLRLDIGFNSNGDNGIYFGVNEAF